MRNRCSQPIGFARRRESDGCGRPPRLPQALVPSRIRSGVPALGQTPPCGRRNQRTQGAERRGPGRASLEGSRAGRPPVARAGLETAEAEPEDPLPGAAQSRAAWGRRKPGKPGAGKRQTRSGTDAGASETGGKFSGGEADFFSFGGVGFPEGVEPTAEQGAANRQQMRSALAAPEHS